MTAAPPEQLTLAGGERYDFPAICTAPVTVVADLFRRGTAPALRDLAGWEYKGRNLSPVSALLRIRRFTKGFLPLPGGEGDAEPAAIVGYNVWVKQVGAPSEDWVPVLRRGEARRHGFYEVTPPGASTTEHRHPHAVLLDYSRAENPWYHPARLLRDHVVSVYPDDPGLLVGNVYVAVESRRIFTGYFTMVRARRTA